MKKNHVIVAGIVAIIIIVALASGLGWVLIKQHKAQPTNSSSSSSSSNTNNVTGTLSLKDTSFVNMTSGDACEGSGGYSDITQGAQVVASDNANTILAVSSLSAGVADGSGNCVFSFTINNVPYSAFYQFQVSHRGQLAYSYQQLSSNNFAISTTLGN